MSQMENHTGTLIKPHGFKGGLLMKGYPGNLRKLQQGMPLFIDIAGQRIPFFIEEISHDSSGEKCIILFEFINSEDEARHYTGCEVFDQPERHSEVQDSAFRPEEYIGFLVTDISTNNQYRVKDFFNHPTNPILLLERQDIEVMLPVQADYLLSVDLHRRIIMADFPEGLVIS